MISFSTPSISVLSVATMLRGKVRTVCSGSLLVPTQIRELCVSSMNITTRAPSGMPGKPLAISSESPSTNRASVFSPATYMMVVLSSVTPGLPGTEGSGSGVGFGSASSPPQAVSIDAAARAATMARHTWWRWKKSSNMAQR